ncbi:Hypothetical protein R9X50_00122300 [Acrodontium crateriforme]|uniref:PHD-type domain-containing protein n=1 Tax=Acrodontium crateriforme TaxID=150365 RepID=A0AAQ3LZ23_9PEZI|nr:Hypothetical protein R9X50_00122300 [Acrodontium crateriforme]
MARYSLSSLLNPVDVQAPPTTTAHALPHTNSLTSASLPSIHHLHDPDSLRASYPYTDRRHDIPLAMDEALKALKSLSESNAPPPASTAQWQRSSAQSKSDISPATPVEPPSQVSRENGSPTLEQYRVSSRSPEQRKASIKSPMHAEFTLTPMQGVEIEQNESDKSASLAQRQSNAGSSAINSLTGASGLSREDLRSQSNSAHLGSNTDGEPSSPTRIKQEAVPTPRAVSPANVNHPPPSQQSAVASLKNEQSLRVQSPLRESSVPVPSTEMPSTEQSTKKRPAPPRTKKGTASIMKKAPPSKKRKIEPKNSETPSSSRASRPSGFKTGSTKSTPANSSPARSSRSDSADPDDDVDDDDEGDGSEDDGGTYCICRKSDTGTFMIGCDGTCDDWFHGKCVGIQERDKGLIDKYLCPNCTEAGIGLTTWKRICRRRGCRQPARVTKNKGGSKYCSEECGVLYFREMVAKTRGREETIRDRSSRRKTNTAHTDDDDLGARGGLLAAGEVKGLLDSASSAADFGKLGEGALSPPATANGKEAGVAAEEVFTEAETEALDRIRLQKDNARRRHQLLKDRLKFITLVKQASGRMATEKELKPKDYCGYDPRIEWTEDNFAAWRESPIGKRAFELETLAMNDNGEKNEHGDAVVEDADGSQTKAALEICDRKKCPRHAEWAKLSVDDLRFEMSNNSDDMRALDKEEMQIRERAALRGKAGGTKNEGYAEVHGQTLTNGNHVSNGDFMDIDPVIKETPSIVETVEITSGVQPVLDAPEDMVVDGTT